MALFLGIDTGGTFTDAALLDMVDDGSGGTVLAKAKSLTTRHDLAVGISKAAQAVLQHSKCDPKAINLVSLSTTLATNALVEGQGGRIAFIAIGFEERDLKNAGLSEALGEDPVVLMQGGHTTHGAQAKPLNMEILEQQIDALGAEVSGFAVAGYFAVRNPAHEIAVRDFILARTGKAVTCSHELSAKLNGPKRALTTVLNARLVPMITRLIEATEQSLEAQNITAPVMVVRGDGALVRADFASKRPIETILSGPAASLVGARFLTGADQAFVNDIGGTTSDVAVLENGAPRLDPEGAMVGGFRTMVEAVAMHTFGLGGDSEVSLAGSALSLTLSLGPRRLVPISLIAHNDGALVHEALDRQLKSSLNGRYDGRFAFLSGAGLEAGLSASEAKLLALMSQRPQALEGLLQGTMQAAALKRLVKRGLVLIAGLTPSDAMHGLDLHDIWDKKAALKALQLFARQRLGTGQVVADDPLVLAQKIIEQVQRRSAEVVLQTAFMIDGKDGEKDVQHPLIQEVLNQREKPQNSNSMVHLDLSLDRPFIGLGASAHAYHPQAAHLLGVEALVPEGADVANAIGAVVGQIIMRAQIEISQPVEGCFQVMGLEQAFAREDLAMKAAHQAAHEKVLSLAQEAGAGDVEITFVEDIKRATIESRDMFIEATIVATATGRPPII